MSATELEVVTGNTHMGRSVRNGGIKTLVGDLRPDLVSLQEVTLRELARLYQQIGKDYAIVPGLGTGQSGTVAALRRATVGLERASNRRLSKHRDNMHPERRNTKVLATHRPTGRALRFHAVHLWAMGQGWNSPPAVIKGHVHQVRAIAASCRRPDAGTAVLAAGDFNEDLDGHVAARNEHRTAAAILAAAGMVPAHQLLDQHGATSKDGSSLLDDVFHRAGGPLRLLSRRVLEIPGTGDDHRAVATRYHIKELR